MNEFVMYLEEQLSLYQQQEQKLLAEDCKDEANFAKIKINVCGICKTLYQVASKKEEEAAITEEYLRLLNRLITEWKASYEKAKEYDDKEKIVVEETKLEVIEMIMCKYKEGQV